MRRTRERNGVCILVETKTSVLAKIIHHCRHDSFVVQPTYVAATVYPLGLAGHPELRCSTGRAQYTDTGSMQSMYPACVPRASSTRIRCTVLFVRRTRGWNVPRSFETHLQLEHIGEQAKGKLFTFQLKSPVIL